jgi:hypothetical protein
MKKFLTTLAVLTAFATPAFAQSFDPDNGIRPSGLHSFAMVPGPRPAFNSDSPEATGGGSLGYNELLRTY